MKGSVHKCSWITGRREHNAIWSFQHLMSFEFLIFMAGVSSLYL